MNVLINLTLSWLMIQPWEHTLFQLCHACRLKQVKSWKNVLDKNNKKLTIFSQISFILLDHLISFDQTLKYLEFQTVCKQCASSSEDMKEIFFKKKISSKLQ